MYTVLGKFITKSRLAELACEIEIDRLKEPIGKQDQYAASVGGLNIIRFDPSEKVYVERIHIKKDVYNALQKNLLLFYMNKQRKTSSILTEQKKNMNSQEKLDILKRMVELVSELRESLYSGDLDEFGRIIHKNWQLKRQLASRITSSEIDDIYELALKNGALGGKILGAGGGGFFLFYCPEKYHEKLRSALISLRETRFLFEDEGSKVIYVGDEYNEH